MNNPRVTRRTLMSAALAAAIVSLTAPASAQDRWAAAAANGELSRQAVRFCRSFARGWLVHADPRSGLLPRNLTGDAYWNAKDSAADNYPFIVLAAHVLDDTYLKEASLAILERETKLTSRLDSLPDDFLFATQAFRTPEPSLEADHLRSGGIRQGRPDAHHRVAGTVSLVRTDEGPRRRRLQARGDRDALRTDPLG